MSNLKDRQGPNLNKKILEVLNIERDESGEIISMEVEVVRNDEEGLIEEGTPLNAKNLSEVIERIVNEEVNTIPLTDAEKVLSEKNGLKIEQIVTDTLILPSTGKRGCAIEWSVIEGEGISITDNVATITQDSVVQTAKIKATISYGEASDTKYFTIRILERELNNTEKIALDLERLNMPTYVVGSFDLPIPTYSKVSWTYGVTEGVTVLGNRVNVERATSNYSIRFVGTFSCGEATETKAYIVTVIGTESYSPNRIERSLIQETGNPKTLNINVVTSSLAGLYLEVEEVVDEYLSINIINNDSTNVSVQLTESSTLNSSTGSAALELEFNITVYLDVTKDILIGTIPCTINYYFASQTPED